MLMLRIAWRNIFRHKRRSLLTGLMMAGGFALFSVSFGFVDGSYDMIIEMFTRDRTGHVQVHAEGYLDRPSLHKLIHDAPEAGRAIAGVRGVEAWAPRVHGAALAFAGAKTTGIRLTGFDPALERGVTRVGAKVARGRFVADDPMAFELVVPARVARVLNVEVGGEVALISQAADGSMATELFTVVGVMDEGDSTYGGAGVAFTHIGSARAFYLLAPTEAHEIAVALTSHRESERAASLMDAALARVDNGGRPLHAEPWQVVEAQFHQAMQADLKGNWITLSVITLIVAVGVLNTVLMVILERTREFGVLRAIGTRPSQVFFLIVTETLLLAMLSVCAGTVGGLLGNWYFSVYGITYPEPIEWGGILIDRALARITPRSIYLPTLTIIATALAVSIWPGIRAARIVPVKALREQ